MIKNTFLTIIIVYSDNNAKIVINYKFLGNYYLLFLFLCKLLRVTEIDKKTRIILFKLL